MPESTIFPFISVLLCTMGAMILVWMSFSLTTSLADPRRGQEADAAEHDTASLAQLVAEGQGQLRSLADLTASSNERLASLAALLAARLRDLDAAGAKQRELAASTTQLQAAVAPMRSAESRLADLRQRRQAAESALTTERRADALATSETRLQRELAAQVARRTALDRLAERNRQAEAEIAAIGPGGRAVLKRRADNVLRPLLVEVAGAGVRLLPGDLGKPAQPTAKALADGGSLRRVAEGTADGSSCLVLLVRPDGAAEARRIAGALRDLRAVFTSEPVDADWSLAGLAEQAALPAGGQP
jgi:hypothetical protein